jgi:hypothetical protein
VQELSSLPLRVRLYSVDVMSNSWSVGDDLPLQLAAISDDVSSQFEQSTRPMHGRLCCNTRPNSCMRSQDIRFDGWLPCCAKTTRSASTNDLAVCSSVLRDIAELGSFLSAIDDPHAGIQHSAHLNVVRYDGS